MMNKHKEYGFHNGEFLRNTVGILIVIQLDQANETFCD